jgi:hypothetical protein
MNFFLFIALLIIVLFFAGILFQGLGILLAMFLATLVKPIVSLERGSAHNKEQLKRFFNSRMAALPDTSAHGKGHLIIVRLTDFLLFCGVGIGELTNLASLVPYALGTGTEAMKLPVGLNIAGLFLFLCLPALLFKLYSEAAGLIPSDEAVYHQIDGTLRTKMKRGFFACFILSLFTSFLLAYYKAEMFAAQSNDPNALLTGWLAPSDIQTLLFLFTTCLVVIVVAFGNRAFLLGWQSIEIVAAILGITLCAIIHAGAREINRCVNWICYFFSRGKISVYLEVPVPNQQLTDSPPLPQLQPTGQISQEIRPHQIPEHTQKELDIMKSLKTASFVFDRTFGNELYPYIRTAVDQQNAGQYILSSGSDNPIITLRRRLPDTIDISPEAGNAPASLPHSTPEEAQTALLKRMGQNLTRVHASRTGLPSSIFLIVGCERLIYCQDMFDEISNNTERSIVVLTTLTREDLQKTVVQQGFTLLNQLWEHRKITGTLIVDPARSGFSVTYGRRALLTFFASILVDCIVAPFHCENNLDSMQVFDHVFASSGFATMSAASAPVDQGTLPRRHRFLEWLPGGNIRTGVGNIESVKNKLTSLITDTLTKPETSALSAHQVPGSRSVYVCEVPTSDTDSLSEIENVVSWFVNQRDPQAQTIFVKANGTQTIHEWRDSYFTQVCRLWSLQPNWFILPEPIEATLAPKALSPAPSPDQKTKSAVPANSLAHLDPLSIEESRVQVGNNNGAPAKLRSRNLVDPEKRKENNHVSQISQPVWMVFRRRSTCWGYCRNYRSHDCSVDFSRLVSL